MIITDQQNIHPKIQYIIDPDRNDNAEYLIDYTYVMCSYNYANEVLQWVVKVLELLTQLGLIARIMTNWNQV